MRSPLNYLGGKSRLAEKIVSLIPRHDCYCEPFCGAAWVFYRKQPSACEVLNDLDGELVTFWRVLQHHPEEFLRFFKFAVISRRLFTLENEKRPETLTDVQRAARYFYLQRLAFGGKTHKRTFGTSAVQGGNLNLGNVEQTVLEIHWRMQKVTIENLHAVDCIQRYDRRRSFFYIDPPYWGTPGYAHPFKPEEYQQLADVLRRIRGRFLLSLNDRPEVRRVFRGFTISLVQTKYSAANGRDSACGRAVPRRELLISNFLT